jgi:hypothetical protein
MEDSNLFISPKDLTNVTILDVNRKIDKLKSELVMEHYHDGWTLKWIKQSLTYWIFVKNLIFREHE